MSLKDTKAQNGFWHDLVRQCGQLLRTDVLFAGATLVFLISSLVTFCSTQNYINGIHPWHLIALWNVGVMLSVLFLYYYERRASATRKILSAAGGFALLVLVSCCVHNLCALKSVMASCQLAITACLFCLLGVVKSPEEASIRHFDEFHPYRFQLRMMEVGLLSAGVFLVAIMLWGLFHFLPFALPKVLVRFAVKAAWLIPSLLILTFCPLYTLCRVVNDGAAEARPRKVFLGFLAFAIVPLTVLSAMIACFNSIASCWMPANNIPLLTGLAGVGAIYILSFAPYQLTTENSTVAKILGCFRKISPYILVLPILCSFLFFYFRWQDRFVLSPNDLSLVIALVSIAVTLGALIAKKSLSVSSVWLIQFSFALPGIFLPVTRCYSPRAEKYFVETLKQHEALVITPQDGLVIKAVDLSTKLLPEEQMKFIHSLETILNSPKKSNEIRQILICLNEAALEKRKGAWGSLGNALGSLVKSQETLSEDLKAWHSADPEAIAAMITSAQTEIKKVEEQLRTVPACSALLGYFNVTKDLRITYKEGRLEIKKQTKWGFVTKEYDLFLGQRLGFIKTESQEKNSTIEKDNPSQKTQLPSDRVPPQVKENEQEGAKKNS